MKFLNFKSNNYMKTKLFLSALAFAMVAIAFMYNNSYSQEKSCCCNDCKCSTCACSETCCKDNSCSGCSTNNCCDANVSDKSCCVKGNASGESVSGNIEKNVSGDSAMVCMVSGEKIEKGKEITLNYLGKDYNFCCKDCEAKFKKEPMDYAKDGLNCPVMDEPAKKTIYSVVDGTKYYFCCKMCIKDFEGNPDKYLKKNDKEPKTDNK